MNNNDLTNNYLNNKKNYLIKFINNRLKIYTALNYGDLLGLIYHIHLNETYRNIVDIKLITDNNELDKYKKIISQQDAIISKNKGKYLSFQDVNI